MSVSVPRVASAGVGRRVGLGRADGGPVSGEGRSVAGAVLQGHLGEVHLLLSSTGHAGSGDGGQSLRRAVDRVAAQRLRSGWCAAPVLLRSSTAAVIDCCVGSRL